MEIKLIDIFLLPFIINSGVMIYVEIVSIGIIIHVVIYFLWILGHHLAAQS